MSKMRFPMKLQFFAESGNEGGQSGQEGQQSNQPPTVDYDKIQQMLTGTLQAKEDTALKAYFKQQGLSEAEMKQAIDTFKTQKAQQQPDVAALETRAIQAETSQQKQAVENKAIIAAMDLNIDAKSIPYLIKMADLSGVVGQDGKINEESVKTALEKVIEDIPALKPQQASGGNGYIQVGGGNHQGQGANAVDDELDKIFGVKK